ncbi:MAG: NAD-dependent epimerase/dehydratase family protein [Pseudobdellovibrio sp.]
MQNSTGEPQIVLITGAAGFIGSHLSEYYLKFNYHVIGLDNYLTGSKENILELKEKFPEKFIFFEFDVCHAWSEVHEYLLKKNMRAIQYVFHLASPASPESYRKYSLETINVNTVGLFNSLKFADEYKAKLIFSSTSEIYGDPLITPQPESYFGHVNSFGDRACYDEAKRCGEAIIYAYNKRYNKRHGLVRIFNTYGPRMSLNDGRVIVNFIKQALNQDAITVYGDGLQTRSFCYVDDLICALDLYAQSEECKPMNIGRDEEITIKTVALHVQDISRKLLQQETNIIFKDLPQDDPRQRRPDLSLAKDVLSWSAKIDFKKGFESTFAWFLGKHKLN